MTETVGSEAAQKTAASSKAEGLTIERLYTTPGVHPYDEVTWDRRDVVQTNWKTGSNFRAARCRVPRLVERQRLDDRHQQVLPRRGRHARARVEPAPADRPGRAHLRQGRQGQRLLRHPRRRRGLRARADLDAAAPGVRVQLAGVVQRGHVEPAAGERRASRTTRWCLRRTVSCPSASWSTTTRSAPRSIDAHGVTQVAGDQGQWRQERAATAHQGRVRARRHGGPPGLEEQRRPGSGRFVEAGTLRPGDKLAWHRRDAHGEAEIDQRQIAEAALAGWMQSDGFVGQYTGTNRSLTLEAMTVTPSELAWVTRALDEVFPGATATSAPS